MKKYLKKFVAVILTTTLAFSLGMPAFAEEVNLSEEDLNESNATIVTMTNEYDAILELKNMPVTMMQENGYSEEEIEAIKSFSIEEALLERAQYSEEELRNWGYDDNQITLLKNYDGSPLEDNPQMRAAMATMSGQLSEVNSSSNKITAKFDWTWSNRPVLSGNAVNDLVTCGFMATSVGSSPHTVTANQVSCLIHYYTDDGTEIGSSTYAIGYIDPHAHVEARFPMAKRFNNIEGWAKKGTLRVGAVEEAPANQLYSVTFVFGYGHSSVGVEPDISVSLNPKLLGGVGLNFSSFTTQMYYRTIIVRNGASNEQFPGPTV